MVAIFKTPKQEVEVTLSYNDVIKFWFEEIDPKQRWIKDAKFDALIAQRFGDLHEKANSSELNSWRDNAKGALAEIIILDQFSRNIFRDTPSAFASAALLLLCSYSTPALLLLCIWVLGRVAIRLPNQPELPKSRIVARLRHALP